MTTVADHIAEGIAVYERHLPGLLAHTGHHVVIGDGRVAGVRPTADEAFALAYATFGVRPFLVHQIEMVPTVHHLGWYSL